MAMTLLDGKTFTDAAGNMYTTPYLVIDTCDGNKRDKQQFFIVEIYKDKDTRDQKKMPISRISYLVKDGDWSTFFSVAAVDADSDQYSRAYDYIKQLKLSSTSTTSGDDGNIFTTVSYGDNVWADWIDC